VNLAARLALQFLSDRKRLMASACSVPSVSFATCTALRVDAEAMNRGQSTTILPMRNQLVVRPCLGD